MRNEDTYIGSSLLVLLNVHILTHLCKDRGEEVKKTDAARQQQGEGLDDKAAALLRQYVYFCTSKPSKLNTGSSQAKALTTKLR